MKILIPNWKSFGLEDIVSTLEQLGHTVQLLDQEPENYRKDPRYKSELKSHLRSGHFQMVFSSNYYPVLSDACQELKIPYLSWCYDSPLVLTYHRSIMNPCNYVFLFDSHMAAQLQALGAPHIYYMPLAVNTSRLSALHATAEQRSLIDADVSFVGSLYTEKHSLYDRMTNLDDYTRGYLEGIMKAQRSIYGHFFLEDMLPPDILETLTEVMPLETHADGYETLSYLYANYFLCRKMTQLDRIEILSLLSENWENLIPPTHRKNGLKLYTPEATPFLPKIKNMGTVHYLNEMPLVFRHSKINLNITLRSIQTGIPLRALDIMGAGGFLLTNYQSDFTHHFTDGEDYVSYSSQDELFSKIEYYLTHEKEREEIAANGYRKICTKHNYGKRLEEMLNIVLNA